MILVDEAIHFCIFQPAEQARRQNSTQANQLRHCQQRIENLESELQRIQTVCENSQRDLQSARTDTQMRVQGDLIQVLEDDLNCVICSDILIEVNNFLTQGVQGEP